MANILLLFLEGPFQSWGLRARWDVRDTGDEPSKSGVIGLIGCALGYPVADLRLEELDQQLRMGVRVERPGNRMIDFQTVTGVMASAEGKVRGTPDEPHTIVSPRAYLQDAAFLVALHGPKGLLERSAVAVQNPRWPIYLGRKACIPTRPVFETLTDRYESLEGALRFYPPQVRTWGAPPPSRYRCIVEDRDGRSLRPDRLRVNPARMYDTRAVRVDWVDHPMADPPIASD